MLERCKALTTETLYTQAASKDTLKYYNGVPTLIPPNQLNQWRDSLNTPEMAV